MSETENKLRELILASGNAELIETFRQFSQEIHNFNDELKEKIENDLRLIAKHFETTPDEIKSKSRFPHLVNARSVFFHRARNHYGLSTTKSGKFLNRSHCTVLHHANNRIDDIYGHQMSWKSDYEKIFNHQTK